MIKENQKFLNQMAVILDMICIPVALIVAWVIRFKSGWIHMDADYLTLQAYLKPSIILIPLYILIYHSFKLYTPRRTKGIYDEIINIIKANIIGLLIFTLILYLLKEINYSRYFLFLFAVFNISLTAIVRFFIKNTLRILRKSGKNLKHIILVGYSDGAKNFFEKVHNNKHWGYNIIGVLDENFDLPQNYNFNVEELQNTLNETEQQAAATISIQTDNNLKLSNENFIGKIDDLEKILNEFTLDEVFITLSIKEYDKIGNIIGICEKHGIRTQIIPDYYKYIPAKPYVEEVEGIPIINIRYIPLDNLLNKIVKRLFDILVSLICIVFFSPIMLTTAIIIKITSPGYIIFNQDRVGCNRKNFTMYKFRSMHIQRDEDEKIEWTTKDDPRKTKFGNFIRKTSIDELPQLFNVLKGDMSLIGPRPERPYFVDKFKEEIPKYMVKHQVRPGMTGWAQVNGLRGDTSIKKRIDCDIYYIENWSLGLDIKIIWFTLFRGFVNKNAY